MLHESETLTLEEYEAMTEEELEEFYKEAKKIVKERMANNL